MDLQHDRPKVTDLPNEIVDIIARFLPRKGVAALRLTCRRLQEHTTNAFGRKLLTINSDLHDLMNLSKLSFVPALQNSTRTLRFVFGCPWPGILCVERRRRSRRWDMFLSAVANVSIMEELREALKEFSPQVQLVHGGDVHPGVYAAILMKALPRFRKLKTLELDVWQDLDQRSVKLQQFPDELFTTTFSALARCGIELNYFTNFGGLINEVKLSTGMSLKRLHSTAAQSAIFKHLEHLHMKLSTKRELCFPEDVSNLCSLIGGMKHLRKLALCLDRSPKSAVVLDGCPNVSYCPSSLQLLS